MITHAAISPFPLAIIVIPFHVPSVSHLYHQLHCLLLPYTHKSQYNGMRDGNSKTINPIIIYCVLKLLASQYISLKMFSFQAAQLTCPWVLSFVFMLYLLHIYVLVNTTEILQITLIMHLATGLQPHVLLRLLTLTGRWVSVYSRSVIGLHNWAV